MKTYSRKRIGDEDQEIIIDINDVCRLCMGKEDELISIFNSEETVPLSLRIVACVSLEIFEGDGLPDKICRSCKFQLENSYNFRKKCEQSDLKFRQHIRELRELRLNDQNEASMELEELNTENNSNVENNVEDDLAEITKVTYIQQDPEPDRNPEKITTLQTESDNNDKEACTLQDVDDMKAEMDSENDDAEPEQNQIVSNDMDVIANAVRATLSSHKELNLSGQLQFKINQSANKPTEVEVTTEDGSVVVMELLTEIEGSNSVRANPSTANVSEDGDRDVFKCPDCPKTFSRRVQLTRHTSVHMQQRGFSCGICEKWFPTGSALTRHERIHTGERPFQCEVCQKCFAQKEILLRHLSTHTGQKPHQCAHCDTSFYQKDLLRAHMRTHAFEVVAPETLHHYCSICPKIFRHASGLSRHLLTHTGKIFKCKECSKYFTDRTSLRRHHVQTSHEL